VVDWRTRDHRRAYRRLCRRPTLTRRDNPADVWLADGIRPFQLVLLAADKGDIKDAGRSGPTDYRNAKLGHPIVASAHIGFTCSSCSEVKRPAEMAKTEGTLEHGPCKGGRAAIAPTSRTPAVTAWRSFTIRKPACSR
jgi:hypothetical protein